MTSAINPTTTLPPTGPASPPSTAVNEVPPGMETQATLLEAFTAGVPNITRLHAKKGELPGQQWLTVSG